MILTPTPQDPALTKHLKGVIYTDPETLTAASLDFGKVVCKAPKLVVLPAHTDDVVTVIQYARESGYPVAVRGAGHSQGGQSLSSAGIILDTRSLTRLEALDKNEGWVTVGAGMLWGELVQKVLAQGWLPPVLTDNLAVTVGGTLSVGGVGPASFRHGWQINHCLGVEVVLGTGEVVWLTPEHKPDLFHHVLGGLGQFGVITKARLRLRPCLSNCQTLRLTYHQLDTFLADALSLMTTAQTHSLEGFARPKPDFSQQPGKSAYRFILEATTEADGLAAATKLQSVERLSQTAACTVVNRSNSEYVFRLDKAFSGYQRDDRLDQSHPWVEHFLPVAAVEEYVATLAPHFPLTTLLLWPLRAEMLRRPMLAVPSAEIIVLVGIMANVPPAQLAAILPLLRWASQLGIALGGKRYLSGWIDFDEADWRSHYGPSRWQQINKLKQQCDPDGIFQSLF